ncbi:MAG: glycerol-3-phosphate dehydrogenase subunit GlpB [Propionibacteriaceae bacterium]|jgi:glycerol-3-phosphate dehydrogenase subunit B|nr:glycerol-3-phosphate dehydrogenase subunit GlpB [Propionibacteriaceae bacterium]
MTDTIVIGGGLAGLAAAIRLAQAGQSVTLLQYGVGGLQLGQGTVDVLGYAPELVSDPFAGLDAYVGGHKGHPYSLFSPDEIKASVDWFAGLLPDLLVPGDGQNHRVPTALGAMRPTYIVQSSMHVPADVTSVAIVGLRQLKDFYPKMCAENLAKTSGWATSPYWLDFPARAGGVDSTATSYATDLDDPDTLARFAAALKKAIGNEDAVGLPAILGLRNPQVWSVLAEAVGKPVFEIHLGPPGIPGMRLTHELTQEALRLGVRVILGSKVIGFESEGGRISGVLHQQAGRDKVYKADNFVYAGGGFESGSLAMDSYGVVTETLFGLPLAMGQGDSGPLPSHEDLITGDYWADQGLFLAGLAVDSAMKPLDGKTAVYDNLHVAGGILAGAIRWSEKSGDGIAIASAVRAADAILDAQSAKQPRNEGKE